jgi:hypothetical protein
VQEAVDTIWALISPELHELLVCDGGWSAVHYERWLTDALGALQLT